MSQPDVNALADLVVQTIAKSISPIHSRLDTLAEEIRCATVIGSEQATVLKRVDALEAKPEPVIDMGPVWLAVSDLDDRIQSLQTSASAPLFDQDTDEDRVKFVADLVTKEFAVGAEQPRLKQKRILRDEHGRVSGVIEEFVRPHGAESQVE